jgi:putative SOS response-associated peptidase YedK
MCGRYAITSSPEALRALLAYLDLPNFPPRWNVAPTQPVPIVRLDQGQRRFALVRWGLIPSWVKDPKQFSLVFNARADAVNNKPAFQNAMKRRRCLFPADGFYEWRKQGDRSRPYFVRRRDRKPFAFAGLWESWMGPNGEEMESAAIITTGANRLLRAIHERMPVIMAPEAFELWLDTANVDAVTAAALLTPAPEDLLEAYEISTAVNRVANDSAKLIEPVETSDYVEPEPPAKPPKRAKTRGEEDSGQGSLF